MDFREQTAIVTGGARGIGAAIATALQKSGANVRVFDMREGNDPQITYHHVDISQPESIAAALKELPSAATLLVNNAGITRDRTIIKMSDEEWNDVLNVNLTGAFNMIRAVTPGMITAGFGRIVNITSVNGLRGKFGQANYTAAKGGLIALTKTAAREFGRKGITVNAVAPGLVLTEMSMAIPAEFREAALEESLLGVVAEPEDIANGVMFLLSDDARMITGEVLRIDAGQYL